MDLLKETLVYWCFKLSTKNQCFITNTDKSVCACSCSLKHNFKQESFFVIREMNSTTKIKKIQGVNINLIIIII